MSNASQEYDPLCSNWESREYKIRQFIDSLEQLSQHIAEQLHNLHVFVMYIENFS